LKVADWFQRKLKPVLLVLDPLPEKILNLFIRSIFDREKSKLKRNM